VHENSPETKAIAILNWLTLLISSNLQFESNPTGALEEASMTVDDVVGTAARDRYKLNNLRVSIEDAKALEFLKKTSNWLPHFFNGGL